MICNMKHVAKGIERRNVHLPTLRNGYTLACIESLLIKLQLEHVWLVVESFSGLISEVYKKQQHNFLK